MVLTMGISEIHYGQDWDLIIVAFAAANNLGKVANGIADDIVTSTIIASTKPILFVPSMNTYCFYFFIIITFIQFL